MNIIFVHKLDGAFVMVSLFNDLKEFLVFRTVFLTSHQRGDGPYSLYKVIKAGRQCFLEEKRNDLSQ